MRTLSRAARTLITAVTLCGAAAVAGNASAQIAGNGYNPYYFNNQTYSYGMHLPQVPQPNGQDEIRAADGTTCRSSMASNNAYLDVGGIGGQGVDGSFDSGTVYGRLIVPLGGVPNRLDCSSLYNLEIERLRHELQLARSGLSGGAPMGGMAPATAPAGRRGGSKDKAWAESGWSSGGFKPTSSEVSPAYKVPKATIVPMRLLPAESAKRLPAQATQTDSTLPASGAPTPVVEYLPWSSVPATPARVLTGMSTPKRFQLPQEDRPPQSLMQ